MPRRSGLMGQGAMGTTPLGFGVTTGPTPVSTPVPGSLPLSVPAIPHLAVPFTIGPTGAAETVQQGSEAEVTQCVANLVGTRPGTRLLVPRYGTPDPTFSGLNVATLQSAVKKWEPRAVVTVGSVDSGTVSVGVSLAAGGTS